jgi:hypothetical protein
MVTNVCSVAAEAEMENAIQVPRTSRPRDFILDSEKVKLVCNDKRLYPP